MVESLGHKSCHHLFTLRDFEPLVVLEEPLNFRRAVAKFAHARLLM
jgi:hypothetical protein